MPRLGGLGRHFGRLGASDSGVPHWVIARYGGGVLPSLAADFDNNRYWDARFGSQPIEQMFAITRTTDEWAVDSSGNWSQFVSSATSQAGAFARTGLGLNSWVNRTNSIRTSDMTGAVAGDSVELITNGAFAGTSGTGWTVVLNAGTGSVDFSVTGQATLTGDGTHQTNLTQSITTVVGLTYTVQVTVAAQSIFVQAGNSSGSSALLGSTVSAGAAGSRQFTATATTTFIGFAVTAAVSPVVSAISVQSAGRLPNNWVPGSVATFQGLVYSVVAVGVESGLNTIDIRIVGTSTGIFSGVTLVYSDAAFGVISATYGQTWTSSAFGYLVAGSFTNVSSVSFGTQGNAGASAVSTGATPYLAGASPVGNNRRDVSHTPTPTGITSVSQRLITLSASSGVAIDFTLRLAAPQLENSGINSTVASATVAAGGSGYTDGAQTVTLTGGTGTAATLNVTVAGGIITAVNSVTTAGSYTVFPPSPAAFTITGSAGDGLGSLTLTPTNNAAKGFATPPILTTAAAATRNADAITLRNAPTFGAAYSGYVKATPQAAIATNVSQNFMEFGASGQRMVFRRNTITGVPLIVLVGGTGGNILQTGSIPTATTAMMSAAAAAGDQAGFYNSSTSGTNTIAVLPTTPAAVSVGVNSSTTEQANGQIRELALWPTTRVPNAQLQAVTA